jgi:Regulator of chromosome condensation (RCC1) repeat
MKPKQMFWRHQNPYFALFIALTYWITHRLGSNLKDKERNDSPPTIKTTWNALTASRTGMVVGWGNINFGEYGMVSGFQKNGVVAISNHIITNAVAISAGGLFSLAVLENADVVGWGLGQANNLPPRKGLGTNGPVIFNGLPLTGVTAVATGNSHGLALLKDGSVLTWGGNPDVKREYRSGGFGA